MEDCSPPLHAEGVFTHLGYKATLALSAFLQLLAVVVAAFIRFPSYPPSSVITTADGNQVQEEVPGSVSGEEAGGL